MAKSKTTAEKIAEKQQERKQLDNELKRLVQLQKEEEHRAKSDRLCKRGELLESLLPNAISLTDEQLKAFLESTLLTDFAKRKLDGLTAEIENENGGNPV